MKFNIKKVAKRKGLKIYELAKILSKQPTYISKVDNGGVNTTIGFLKSISDALGCEIQELLPTSDTYAHFYDETTGEWLGIRKK